MRLLLTLGVLSAAPALAETGAIQPAGPRTGTNGQAFLNIEGSGNGTNASYGIARFDVSGAISAFNAQFGVGNYTLTDVSLKLIQANSAFTHGGGLGFAFTPDNTSDINSRAFSPFKFPTPAPTQEQITTGTFTQGTAATSPTGNALGNGTVDNYDLFNGAAGSLDLRSDILSSRLATLVINPTDATVAATYGGGISFTAAPTLNITATSANGVSRSFAAPSAVPEPSALAFALVGIPGMALFLRRRKK